MLSEHKLFRKEAIAAQQRAWLGTILIVAPPSRWLVTALAASLATALVLFLIFSQYTRRETVAGQLVPDAGLLNVSAPSAGVISRLSVSDGQSVKAGDVLLELISNQDSARLGDTHVLVGHQLESQRVQLQADLRNQQLSAEKQQESLRDKSALLREQLDQINQQMMIVKAQVDAAQAIFDRIKPLENRGYISALQIQQQQAAVFDSQSQYKTLARQRLDTQQALEAAHQQLVQLPLDTATKRGDTERQIAGIAQSIAQNEGQRAVVLRAPHDGVVSALLLKQGQTVTASQPLLSILPTGSTLQAQLLVPSRAIGFITPGNRVVLRYQAFPYQKFGQHFGRVADVSRSALSTTEVTVLTGQQPTQNQEPLYRVQVILDSQQIMAFGHAEPVRAGMALDADILMERRSLLEWVFEPLYGMGHHLWGASHG